MRGIAPGRKDDVHGVGGSLTLIDIQQTLAEHSDSDADDRVGLGIEVRSATEGMNRDRLLLDVLGPSVERFLADVAQDSAQICGSPEHAGVQEPIDLVASGVEFSNAGAEVFAAGRSIHVPHGTQDSVWVVRVLLTVAVRNNHKRSHQ